MFFIIVSYCLFKKSSVTIFQSSIMITGRSFKISSIGVGDKRGMVPIINASQQRCVSIPRPGGEMQNLYSDKMFMYFSKGSFLFQGNLFITSFLIVCRIFLCGLYKGLLLVWLKLKYKSFFLLDLF